MMEVHIDLDEEELAYVEENGLTEILQDNLGQAIREVAKTKSQQPFLSLVELLKSTGSCSSQTLVQGYPVECDDLVELRVGPVVGEVTDNMAILVVEVRKFKSKSAPISCHLYKKGEANEERCITKDCAFSTPTAFVFHRLEPGTEYIAIFGGVNNIDAKKAFGMFRTKPTYSTMDTFKIIALSCDRPDRMLLGQLNPWYELERKSYNIDVMLHLGDQVYNKGEDNDNTEQLFRSEYETLSPKKQENMKKRARALLRKKYRDTFNKKMTRETLQKGSHLMIWSDNDVANDFTTKKNEAGDQYYPAEFLQCGIQVYREYQRLLWDPDCDTSLPEDPDALFDEYHSHIYGEVGIFLIDMRGNRITAAGIQQSENPIVSDKQWEAIEAMFADDNLKVIIICSEIPFVGDEPATIKEKAEKTDFLKDHWPYNIEDLERLLDLAFNWKAVDDMNREVVFIGGDIHCGVESVIRDEETGLLIKHITTSPVTNHVCKFFPDLQGRINDRYSFTHTVLGETFRNYAEINITLKPSLSVTTQLRPIPTNICRIQEWFSDEED